MRGPGYRHDHDCRRVWRCSRCGRERQTAGHLTSLECTCQAGSWMQIVNEHPGRPFDRVTIVREPLPFSHFFPPGTEPPPYVVPDKPAPTEQSSGVAAEKSAASESPAGRKSDRSTDRANFPNQAEKPSTHRPVEQESVVDEPPTETMDRDDSFGEGL